MWHFSPLLEFASIHPSNQIFVLSETHWGVDWLQLRKCWIDGAKSFALIGVKLLLVGGFNPFEKYYIVKLEIFPKVRGENKKYLKPPPRLGVWWRWLDKIDISIFSQMRCMIVMFIPWHSQSAKKITKTNKSQTFSILFFRIIFWSGFLKHIFLMIKSITPTNTHQKKVFKSGWNIFEKHHHHFLPIWMFFAFIFYCFWLVVSTHLKNMFVKLDHFPK